MKSLRTSPLSRSRICFNLMTVTALLLLCIPAAHAQSGNNSQQLTQSVTAGGGGSSSSGSLQLDGTAGQSVTAKSSGGTFTLESGFWPGAGALTISTLSLSDATSTYGSSVSLLATLSANGVNLSNRLISFSLNGTTVGTANTDSNGLATLNNVALSGINAGTYPGAVTAQFTGDLSFAASNASGQLIVQKATPLVTVTGGTFTYNGQPHPAIVSATGVNNVVLSPLTVLYNGASSLPVNAGSYPVTATFAGNQNYNPATNNQQSIIITQASQSIAFSPLSNKSYGDADFAVSATTSSGLPASFSASGQCSVSSNTVHLTGAGSCTVTASQVGNVNYQAATPVGQTFTVSKANQAITFGALLAKTFGEPDFTVSAKSNSNLVVSFSAAGNCTISGGLVHLTGAGSCTITASQAGNANYNPATDVSQSLTINKATALITLSNLLQTFDGTAKLATATTVPASLSVTLTYSQNNLVVASPINAGSYTVSATINDINYQGTASGTLVINKATPVITWNNPTDITYGAALSSVQLNATANVTGTFTYTPVLGTKLHAGTHQTLSVNFTPTDTTNYNVASQSVSINVLKATQTITFGALGNKAFGDEPLNVSATASSGLAVSFQVVSGPATISGNSVTITGTGTVLIRALQAGDSDYLAATPVDQSFEVTKSTASVTLTNLTQTYDGTPKSATALTNPSGLTVTLTYSQNGQSISSPINAGSYNVSATITDANYQGSTSGILVINKALPVISWNTPSNITYGTALSNAQLNASANVPGSFTYTPPATTVLNVGNHQLAVTFTPTDTLNYTSASQTVQLMVEQVTSTVFNLSSATYSVGEADGHVTITINRTGDTTSAASVDYATSDTAGLQPCSLFNGVASQRCDYATTIGTLRFASGEASKTISIPIVDDSYAEGSESFTITLSNATGESLGSVQTATITISDNDATSGGNPILDSAFFIRQQYIDFLGREPDAQGLTGWLNVLNNCGTTVSQPCDRIEVSSGFFRSPEFQARGYFIYRFYSAVLGRNPSYAEFMPDLAKVSGFLSDTQLEANKVAFVQEFMQRSEYISRYGSLSNTAYVDGLLQTAGLPNHPLRGPWIDVLNNGTATRAQVLRAFTESLEVYNKFYNQAFVVMQYFGYLRRDPDSAYLQWVETLNQTGDYRTMINGFLNSNEYVQRFGP